MYNQHYSVQTDWCVTSIVLGVWDSTRFQPQSQNCLYGGEKNEKGFGHNLRLVIKLALWLGLKPILTGYILEIDRVYDRGN